MIMSNRVVRMATALVLSCAAVVPNPAFGAADVVSDEVFVMTSKGVYENCEDMWFKAFVLDSSTRRLSEKSHTLFFQIRNPADSVVWSEQYPITAGRADGHVYVGDDWQPGEYKVYGVTRTSFAADSVVPLKLRKILVVDNIQKMDSVERANVGRSLPRKSMDSSLHISMVADSAEYGPGSKVRIDISVTDSVGRPVKAELALSAFDWLYHDRYSYSDISAFFADAQPDGRHDAGLPDGVAGHVGIGSRKMARKLDEPGEQYINVYAPEGSSNFVATSSDGGFVINPVLQRQLPHAFFIRPVSGKELKPFISIRNTDAEIASAARKKREVLPLSRIEFADDAAADSLPSYAGRRTYHLDDLEVTARVRYGRRDKFYGYLDSISTVYGTAWVCIHKHGDSYLNDYVRGYTHHPNGYGMDYDGPVQVVRPQKGKRYKIIRYDTSGGIIGILLDIGTAEFRGERHSEEELLRMNGIWKAKGYYPRRRFEHPDTDEEMESGWFDNANTLLWAPSVVTDGEGRASVEFRTSRVASTFYVVANAVDGVGGIGTCVIRFAVRK